MVDIPRVVSFLIADNVFQEKNTNKWNLIGIFDKISSRVFPVIHPSLGLYFKISDALGDYDVKVEYRDSTDKVISIFEVVHIKVQSKLEKFEFGIQTYNLPIPKPGKYKFYLYLNGEFGETFSLEARKV